MKYIGVKSPLACLLLGFIVASGATFADSDEIYTDLFSKKALGGYDTVAYFTEGKALPGKKNIMLDYLGAQWYFVSEENKALFKAAPEKYRPQYGGHCAWAAGAKNAKAKGDPKYWKIVDGKLYLNYNQEVQNKWLADIPGFIKKADKNWPQLSGS